MVELVGEDEVFLAEDGAHGSRVGREAALEDHAGLDVFKARDLLFELHVDAHGAGDGADRARAHAKRVGGGDCGLNQLGVVGQAEIVVAGQVDDLAPVVVADGGLLVVEHAQPEVRAFGAEIVEHGGEVGELGAGCGLRSWHDTSGQSVARRAERKRPGNRMKGVGASCAPFASPLRGSRPFPLPVPTLKRGAKSPRRPPPARCQSERDP